MWEKYDAEDSARESIGTIVKFFTAMNNNNKRTSLNTLYGPLSPPTRLLKPGETDNLRNIKRRVDITTVRRGISNFPSNLLDKNKRYIWVIDDFGDLVFGEDIVQGEEYEGHPTLVDGKPARLGGELFAINDTWYINSKSRAYSSHLPDSPDKGTTYLSNIIEFNFPPSFRPTIAGTGAN